jgi:uncharacterized protein YbjT (DUF2867 family)
MTNGERTILVTGATGKQGGAVLRHLDGKGFRLRAMTRKPTSEPACALAARGVEVVEGDLDDGASVTRALKGAWGVFAVQNTWEAGVEKEEEQGKRIAHLAREHGVQHYVYTSVGSAHLKTGIPHFDNKARVEGVVRGLDFPSHVIIRPVFFMENLLSPWSLQGDKLMMALKPETVLQMVAVDDIGKLGALAFTQSEQLNRREIDIASDAATMPRTAELLSAAQGKQIQFVQLPIETVRQNSLDTALMLEWFDRVGYSADIPALEKTYGIGLTKLPVWVRQNAR